MNTPVQITLVQPYVRFTSGGKAPVLPRIGEHVSLPEHPALKVEKITHMYYTDRNPGITIELEPLP